MRCMLECARGYTGGIWTREVKWRDWTGGDISYHQDEGPQTLCQSLAKEQVADLEGPRQLLQVKLLSSHDVELLSEFQGIYGTIYATAVSWEWSRSSRGMYVLPRQGVCGVWCSGHPPLIEPGPVCQSPVKPASAKPTTPPCRPSPAVPPSLSLSRCPPEHILLFWLWEKEVLCRWNDRYRISSLSLSLTLQDLTRSAISFFVLCVKCYHPFIFCFVCFEWSRSHFHIKNSTVLTSQPSCMDIFYWLLFLFPRDFSVFCFNVLGHSTFYYGAATIK